MSEHAARSGKKQPPSIDPIVQSKLVAKFGPKIMKRGFTALPCLVQDHFRYVPGTVFLKEVVDTETGEISQVEETSHMTPTEYTIMTTIWSYWWSDQSDPWPSVESICAKVGKSERTVRRYLQRLRDKGFMISLEQFNAEGKQVSNRYDFTPFLRRLIAYLDEMEQPAQPTHSPTRDVKTDREWMPEQPGSGCQNNQGIEDESDSNSFNEDTSDSSGGAASSKGTVLPLSATYSHIAHGTIRNTEEETEESHEIESPRTSNPPSTSEELAAGGRAKEVKDNNTGKKLSKYEEFVLASGVPLEKLNALETWLQSHSRPEQAPLLVQALIDPISEQFDNGRLMVSNRTQAAKLYLYARAQGLHQEELEDAFREWIHLAFIHVPPHIVKKMAWFFRALKVEMLKGLMFMAWPPTPLDGEAPSEEEAAAPTTEPYQESASPYHPTREIVLYPDDDPALGWPTAEFAEWCARRLCGDIGAERYEYEVLPTPYQRWGVEFRRRNDQQIEGVFLTKQEMYDYRAKVRARNALVQVLAARTNTEQASHV